MLGKLLKYEFKDTARIIPLFYLTVLIFAGMTISAIQLGIDWIRELSSIILLLLGIVMIIITFVIIVMRFYRNLYSNEGYLMFTLPVKPQQLLASKTIAAFAWVIMSYMVFIGALCISVYGFGVRWDDFTVLFDLLRDYGFQNLVYLLISIILISTLYLLAQIFFAITAANLPVFHKMGIASAFLVFIAINVILQIVGAIFTIFIPLSVEINLVGNISAAFTNKNMFNFMIDSINGATDNVVIGLGGYVFVAVMVCTLFYINGRMMKNRISLK